MNNLDPERDATGIAQNLEQAKKQIRVGFWVAIFSLVITLGATILGATGTLDIGVGADWYMLIDVVIIGACATGMWFKSRTASTIMFVYFLLSKLMLLMEGNFNGIIMGVVFLILYGQAMIGSYRYHSLIGKGARNTKVF